MIHSRKNTAVQGYGWTCFHDSSGPRKLILRMHWPYSEAHENAGSEAMWASYTKVASGSQEVDFKKVVQNACINSKLGFEHSWGVAKWFGIDFEVIEWIWSIFMKIDFQRRLMVFMSICTLISGNARVISPSVVFCKSKFELFHRSLLKTILFHAVVIKMKYNTIQKILFSGHSIRMYRSAVLTDIG